MLNCQHCNVQFVQTAPQQKKFCSIKCKKDWHSLKNRRTKHVWGSLSKERERNFLSKIELYNSLLTTHIIGKNFEKETGLPITRLIKYCNDNLNIKLEPTKVGLALKNNNVVGGITHFYPKEIMDYYESYCNRKNKYKKNIHDGYVPKEYILNTLDICEPTWQDYKKKYVGVPSYDLNKNGFLKADADKWIVYVKQQLRWQEDLKLINKESRLVSKDVKQYLCCVKDSAAAVLREIKQTAIKADRLARKERKHELKRQLFLNPRKKKFKIPFKSKSDWTDWQEYENRQKQKLLEGTLALNAKSLKNNNLYWKRLETGAVERLTCKKCKVDQPFYSFYVARTGLGRNLRKCKNCARMVANNKKIKKTKDSGQFATQYIVSIKRELNKKNNKYLNISAKEIWKALPYTKKEFIEYFTSIMEPWMTWENNTYGKIGMRSWHVDHIIPKSTFNYTSMEDEEFKKCWALSNLKPIEAIVNLIKSDSNYFDINQKAASTFNRVVIKGMPSRRWNYFFDYDPENAREHIKKQFSTGMNWSNHGVIWHIDHIIPKASLPFNEITDENYKKCWALENLKPELITNNTSKGSKHNNKKHALVII